MFAIEKGIPFEQRKWHQDRKYPWDEMEIGDSFLIPLADDVPREEYHRLSSNIGSVARGYSKRNPDKKLTFKPRIVKGGVRVWRVAYEE